MCDGIDRNKYAINTYRLIIVQAYYRTGLLSYRLIIVQAYYRTGLLSYRNILFSGVNNNCKFYSFSNAPICIQYIQNNQ